MAVEEGREQRPAGTLRLADEDERLADLQDGLPPQL
jgi:hypothetical protein